MAFEAYLQQDQLRPRRGRRITYTVSAGVHAAAVLAGVAYSFWHIEEISPRTVTVTFISAAAAPPPPPPAPPLGSSMLAPKHRPAVRPKLESATKTPEVVQPQIEKKDPEEEKPKESPKSESSGPSTDKGIVGGSAAGVNAGVAGGIKGGTAIGTAGGTGPASAIPKFLPPQIGAQQRISGGEPDFPAHLRRPGANYTVRAKICVGTSGLVESVTLIKRAHPELDGNAITALKGWRYRPLMANGKPAPFCYFVVHEFRSE
jgi:outer membrane biosynthesis protein TonB